MKRMVLCAAVATLIAMPGTAVVLDVSNVPGASGVDSPAGIGTLFNQSGACGGNGPASQRFPDFGNSDIQSADDFVVPSGVTWDIDVVLAAGTFFNANPNNGPISAVIVQLWSDNGGLPGTLLCEESGTNETADPNMTLTLSGACEAIMPLSEGTYWLSMEALMPFSPSGQLAWVPNNSANGAGFAFQDPSGLTGNPCTSWGTGTTTCGVGASFADLCFALSGTEGIPGGPPAPSPLTIPTLGSVGLLALLAALAFAGVVVLRLRRAS